MSEFKEWFKTTGAYKMLEEQNYFKMDLFFFVPGRNQYRHSGVQIAFMTWNARQSEIDQLKAEKAGLEKRISKTLEMLDGDLSYVEEDRRRNFDFLQMAMIRCLKDDMKTLRGDDQNTKNGIQAIESNGNRGGDQKERGEHE